MKLQTKFLLALLGGMLAVYLASGLIQRYFNLRSIERFAHHSLDGEESREWAWIARLQQAIDASLLDAMAAGEMDKFEKLLDAQRSVSDLQDLSLHDRQGRVAYSLDAKKLKQDLPPDLKSALLSSPAPVKRRAGDVFESYQPILAQKACIACHADWKENSVCGVVSMRFSAKPLLEAEQGWETFESDYSQANLTTTLVTVLALVGVMALLIRIIVQRMLVVPLRHTSAVLADQASQLTEASREVGNTSQSLAEGASQQAASIEETSASLEEMSSMTKRNTDNAQKANDLARQTRSAADRGVSDMREMSAAVSAIKESSDDIAKIIKTIDEIAFQTNILALNAAVEAARAGEAGMGFAVVADEVRNLAQRSAQAARETAGKIEGAIVRTAQGVALSDKVASALNDIVSKARQMDELAAEVATASGEQTQGIAQINAAVSEMDKVTQHTASNAEEEAAAAEELNAQARAMKQAVGELLAMVNGTQPTSGAGAVPAVPKAQQAKGHQLARRRSAPPVARPDPSPAREMATAAIPMDDDFKSF